MSLDWVLIVDLGTSERLWIRERARVTADRFRLCVLSWRREIVSSLRGLLAYLWRFCWLRGHTRVNNVSSYRGAKAGVIDYDGEIRTASVMSLPNSSEIYAIQLELNVCGKRYWSKGRRAPRSRPRGSWYQKPTADRRLQGFPNAMTRSVA